jgi:hypothetical protein
VKKLLFRKLFLTAREIKQKRRILLGLAERPSYANLMIKAKMSEKHYCNIT